MKICYLITGLDIGGAQKHLLKLLPKTKHEKFVVCLNNKNTLDKEFEEKGIKVYHLGLNKWNLGLAFARMIKILGIENPDLIDSYLIHSNIFARLFSVPRICSVRNDYSDLKVLNFINKWTEWGNEIQVINSPTLMPYMEKNKVKSPIVTIPNGIDLNEIEPNIAFDIRDELGLDKKTKIVTCVARLHKQKGVQELINQFVETQPNIHLLIVGDGPHKPFVPMEIKNRVHFLYERKDVIDILNSSDVFVLLSNKEGMSNALMEAMALSLPCIVSDIPQNKLLIEDDENGVIFKESIGLPNCIEKALKFEEKYGKNAYKTIKENYQMKDTVKKYEMMIEAAMK